MEKKKTEKEKRKHTGETEEKTEEEWNREFYTIPLCAVNGIFIDTPPCV